ncbi:MAG: GTP cyclohydrolase 1 [Bacteroidia bacterium]|nr:MAG: GTP cyclohydrolase 1 [Bacteroidia bacterium]
MKNQVKDIEKLLMNSDLNTPLRHDAFLLSDDEKVELITEKFSEIMNILGLDLTDDSLKDTPKRVAKMYVKEIFEGLNPNKLPKLSLFENKYGYHQILLEKNIHFTSTCEHHFLPIVGKAHVAYIPNEKVVGLSKLNRVVKYFAKRPQVQERLTLQIAEYLQDALNTEHVAVIIDAEHYCIISRGIEDINSSTVTSEFRGKFQDFDMQNKLMQMIA